MNLGALDSYKNIYNCPKLPKITSTSRRLVAGRRQQSDDRHATKGRRLADIPSDYLLFGATVSKRQSQHELQDTGISRRSDLPETRCADRASRVAEVDVVKYVEELCAEL